MAIPLTRAQIEADRKKWEKMRLAWDWATDLAAKATGVQPREYGAVPDLLSSLSLYAAELEKCWGLLETVTLPGPLMGTPEFEGWLTKRRQEIQEARTYLFQIGEKGQTE